jgi:hypothetical protein
MNKPKTELRKPFADAYQLLLKAADNAQFPHNFDLDDALLAAQTFADGRANGEQEPAINDALFSPIGQLPYVMLSYLGQVPPDALTSEFKTRTDRILGFIEDGSIEREIAVGDQWDLVNAKRDLKSLRRRWLKTPEGETPLPNDALMGALITWFFVVAKVVTDFASNGAPPSAPGN